MQQIQILVAVLFISGMQSVPMQIPNTAPLIESFHQIMDKLEEVEQAHLKTDNGFRAAVLYLQGQEWRNVVNVAVKSPEYIAFDEMANKYGLNISKGVECLRNHIASLKVAPTEVTAKPNLDPFIQDLLKSLPIADIAKLLTARKDDPKVIKIRQEIGSEKNQKIAEQLHNIPEMKKLRKVLKEMNFDVEPYIALAYTFIGWVH